MKKIIFLLVMFLTGIIVHGQGTPAKHRKSPPADTKTTDVIHIPKHQTDEVASYCIPFADCSYGDGFEIFVLEEIENLDSGCSPDGYGDFTTMEATLAAGEEYIIYVVSNYGENNVSVWIDFNDDEEFAPDEMLVDDFWVEIGGGVYEISFTIPPDAISGFHRLRARANYMESASDPCVDFIDGETEDYTVEIIGGGQFVDVGVVSIDIPENVPPGPVEVAVTLKNYGTETQTVQLSIINNVDFGTSAFVNDLLSGETRQINYGVWNAEIGEYTFHSYLTDPDDNNDNNQLFKEVVVEQPNLPPPQNLGAEVISNSVSLNWDAPEIRGLLGYNVYNNGSLVADSLTQQFYTDLCLARGNYSYTVTAIYNLGGSIPCGPVEVSVEYCELLIQTDDFEAYVAGQQLVTQAENLGIDYWHCWNQPAGSDEDPYISDDVFYEGNNSMLIEGLNDVAMDLGAKTEGKYSINFKIYVPSGFDGYFGIWKEVSSGSYGMEAYFNEDETGFAMVANSDWKAFTYSANTWNDVEAIIDLDNDWAAMFINGTRICQAQWSLGQYGAPGPLKLDVIDFYAGVLWEGIPKSYVDDIEFKQIIDEALPPENLQATVDGEDILLSWDAPMEGVVEYWIYEGGALLTSTTDLSFLFEGLEAGEYQYEVKAVYGECESLSAGPVIATVHPFQTIDIPAGWSGLSSCINPSNPNIETIFQPIVGQLIILQNETGMYWPGENVNTLVNWDTHEGYKIKVDENVGLTVAGPWTTNKTVQLNTGWNIIPVLSSCDVNVEDLFAGLDVVLVKEIAGNLLWWPDYGIGSLDFLLSGRAYFVLMGSGGEITYPECGSLKNLALSEFTMLPEDLTGLQDLLGLVPTPNHTIAIPNNECQITSNSPFPPAKAKRRTGRGRTSTTEAVISKNMTLLVRTGQNLTESLDLSEFTMLPEDLTGFQNLLGLVPTPNTHTIAIHNNAIPKNLMGHILGAFNQNGDCFSWMYLSGKNAAMTIYGDDPTTPEIDGFMEYEPITFRFFSEDDLKFQDVDVTFDTGLPQHDGLFLTDGISAIQNLEAGATGLSEILAGQSRVYPNPARGVVNISLGATIKTPAKLEIIDLQGKLIRQFDLSQDISPINISELERGVYILRMSADGFVLTKRLVKE